MMLKGFLKCFCGVSGLLLFFSSSVESSALMDASNALVGQIQTNASNALTRKKSQFISGISQMSNPSKNTSQAGSGSATIAPGARVLVKRGNQKTIQASFFSSGMHNHGTYYPYGIKGYPDSNVLRRYRYLFGIRRWGGEVIHVAHTIKVVIPSALLFRGDTNFFYYRNMPILNYVAGLIKTYQTVNVGIKAYYGHYYTKDQQKYFQRLTRKQAERVEAYLWERCHHSRLMYARGYGVRFPVANQNGHLSSYYNSRVEVSFKYYYDRVL